MTKLDPPFKNKKHTHSAIQNVAEDDGIIRCLKQPVLDTTLAT